MGEGQGEERQQTCSLDQGCTVYQRCCQRLLFRFVPTLFLIYIKYHCPNIGVNITGIDTVILLKKTLTL